MEAAILKVIKAIESCEGAFKELEDICSNGLPAGNLVTDLALESALELRRRHEHFMSESANRRDFISRLIRLLHDRLDARTLYPGAHGLDMWSDTAGVSGDHHTIDSMDITTLGLNMTDPGINSLLESCKGAFKELEDICSNVLPGGSADTDSALELAFELRCRHDHFESECTNRRVFIINRLIRLLQHRLDGHALYPGAAGLLEQWSDVAGVSGRRHTIESLALAALGLNEHEIEEIV